MREKKEVKRRKAEKTILFKAQIKKRIRIKGITSIHKQKKAVTEVTGDALLGLFASCLASA